MNKLGKISAAGLIFIALMEGFAPPYRDVGGVWTNGFGNTKNGQQSVTVPQALKQLGENANEATYAVIVCLDVVPEQNEIDAFTSLTFNIGSRAFCQSTLVKKYRAGDKAGACKEILRWDYVQGKKVAGLTNRRRAEYDMCMENKREIH